MIAQRLPQESSDVSLVKKKDRTQPFSADIGVPPLELLTFINVIIIINFRFIGQKYAASH